MRCYVCSFVAFVFACSSGKGAAPAFAAHDSAGVIIAENTLDSLTATCELSREPVVSIGGTEDSDDYFLYRVMGMTRLSDGRIAVVNQGTQEVRWYSPKGILVGRAGREGRGPGEFAAAYLIAYMPGDTVWVGDYRPWQWHVFGPGMEFVRTIRPGTNEINPPRAFAIFDDGQEFFASSDGRRLGNWQLDSFTVKRFDAAGKLLDTIATLPDARFGNPSDPNSSFSMRPWFEPSAYLAGGGSRMVVATWGEPELTVYQVGKTITPIQVIRWTTADRTISAGDVKAARAQVLEEYADVDERMRATMVDPMVHPDRPVAAMFPVIQGLEVGRDGRIWVREFVKPGASAPELNPWIAFDQDGRAVCRAQLPTFNYNGEFGADYLLRLDRDSLGVSRVQEYRLGEPMEGAVN